MTTPSSCGVGGRTPRPDAIAKVTGETRYVSDLDVPGLLCGAIKPSPLASARIRRIDVTRARALPGVLAVLTAADLPCPNDIGMIFPDQPLLAVDRVRMAGERLALVAAETPAACAAALEAIEVDLEPLPGVYDLDHALDEDAPRVHDAGNLIREFAVARGDVALARQAAEVVLEETFHIGGQEHGYLEPQGCLVIPGPGGGLTIQASCQCPFYVRGSVAKLLGVPLGDLRVIQSPTGGGFGGKEDYPSEVAACAAVLARATRRPVRLVLPRELDFQASTKRHRMTVRHRLFASAAGRVLGVDVEVLVDAGAYAGLSTVVAERANASTVGPYAVDAVRVVTKVCYTNNLFGGPYRGFGAPQVTVAHECQLDRLARQVGLSPLEVRRLNALGPGAATWSTGETIASPERYGAVLEQAGRILAAGDAGSTTDPTGRYRFGTGLATFIYGSNLHSGGQRYDRGGAYLLVQADGSVNVAIGVTEMGQGALAAARAMAAEALGAPDEAIRVSEVDTALVADSGPTVASRATLVAGRAILDAAEQLLPRLRALAAEPLGVAEDQVEVRHGGGFGVAGSDRTVSFAEVAALMNARRVNPAAVGYYRSDDRIYDVPTGQGQAYPFYSFGAHVTRVRVDTWTGKVDVLSIDAVHDVGRVIHATALEGQVEGGAVQAAGWATMEDLHLREGRLLNPSFTDYLMPTAVDAPVVRLHLIEDPEPQGPFGARGIGEPSFIPGGAAIACAVARALGRPVAVLPLVPERVLGLITQA